MKAAKIWVNFLSAKDAQVNLTAEARAILNAEGWVPIGNETTKDANVPKVIAVRVKHMRGEL
jgi:hypothetical protein